MDRDRRRLVEGLFEEILDRPPTEWDGAVTELCGSVEALEEDVRRLLSAHRRADGLLDIPFPFPEPAQEPERGVHPTERVGKYRVLRQIGRGGMANVYLADRADGHFNQRVALKVIRDADPDLHARLVAERQILASLEHPNIGRLLDGGVMSDGRPFLVMEYVDGLSIDLYCDRMRLTLRERLGLFLTVLKAVEHAHHSLVVHRDLKPSNILVTPSGEVKLLDFGIARILDPVPGGPAPPLTRAQDRTLTPEYASPEQIRGEPITTSSDVYSLGTVLYEILTGRRPHDLARGSLPELVKEICEEEPLPPSRRVAASGGSAGPGGEASGPDPAALAGARRTTSARLRRQLNGDLDAIVMKALRKEPTRRYGSVELFSQDIRFFMGALPVGARRGTRWYRMGKVIRRHRGGAVAAALVAGSIVLGGGVAAWQAREASGERDRAREALRESEEVTGFLLGLFQASDPTESPGDTVTVLDLLARGAARAGELRGEPVVQARMLNVMAQANLNLGRYPEAEALAGQGLALLKDHFGYDHEEVAEAMVQLGSALRSGGRYDSARVVLERAREIQARVLGPDALELSYTLEAQAGVDVYLGDLGRAEGRARESLGLRERHLGPYADATVDILGRLAAIHRFQARYGEAETGFREALRRRRMAEAPGPARLSSALLQVADMAVTYGGELDEAERLVREALQLQGPGNGVSTPNRVWALTSLANIERMRGDGREAERLLRQALEERKRTYGILHPLVSESLGELGVFLGGIGRFQEAEAMLRQAEEVDSRTVGPDHTRHAGTLSALAEVLARLGRLEEADSMATRAVEIRMQAQGAEGSAVAQTLATLGEIRVERGLYESAEPILLRAMAAAAGQPADAALPRRIHRGLADLYEATDRPEESARHRGLASAGS